MTTTSCNMLQAYGEPMTHRRIILRAEQQPDRPSADYGSRAEQLIEDSSYLPLEGDQSWREQDARRIFSAQSEDEVNYEDYAPADVAAESDDTSAEPRLESRKVVGVLLPISLATFVMVLAVTVSMPEILTGGFWSDAGSKRSPDAAMTSANAAPAPGKLRPSLAENVRPVARPVQTTDKLKAPPRQVAQAAPGPKAERPAPVTVATAERLPPIGSKTRSAKRSRTLSLADKLDAAYAAMPAPQPAANESTVVDWKAQAARWDELANKIRARSGKYKRDGQDDFTASRDESSREFR
jgi:hypothetical protein